MSNYKHVHEFHTYKNSIPDELWDNSEGWEKRAFSAGYDLAQSRLQKENEELRELLRDAVYMINGGLISQKEKTDFLNRPEVKVLLERISK